MEEGENYQGFFAQILPFIPVYGPLTGGWLAPRQMSNFPPNVPFPPPPNHRG